MQGKAKESQREIDIKLYFLGCFTQQCLELALTGCALATTNHDVFLSVIALKCNPFTARAGFARVKVISAIKIT